jgi:hypothetical protein
VSEHRPRELFERSPGRFSQASLPNRRSRNNTELRTVPAVAATAYEAEEAREKMSP